MERFKDDTITPHLVAGSTEVESASRNKPFKKILRVKVSSHFSPDELRLSRRRSKAFCSQIVSKLFGTLLRTIAHGTTIGVDGESSKMREDVQPEK